MERRAGLRRGDGREDRGIKAMVNLGRIGEGQYAEVLNYAVGERSDRVRLSN